MKLPASEIKQAMYELGYAYYPVEKIFKKSHGVDSFDRIYKLDEPIVKTWKEAREFVQNTENE